MQEPDSVQRDCLQTNVLKLSDILLYGVIKAKSHILCSYIKKRISGHVNIGFDCVHCQFLRYFSNFNWVNCV